MKVIVIGCGNVGMSYAYTLVNHPNRVSKLVLIDKNVEKAKGEALDLNHALPFSSSKMEIKAGDYSDCNDADLICICAGRNQEIGETRLDLINKNYVVFKDIITQINKTKFNGIYLVATNPVDVMSYITYKLSKNEKKVIGSGTTLDTARLKYLIGEKLKISSRNIHAYVLGEHGDSEMILWSKATIGVKYIDKFLNKDEMRKLEIEVRDSAYDIINKKGNTCYGIGVCLLRITNSIFNNENSILTLSVYDEENDIYISKPAIVNLDGVREIIEIDFNDEEKIKFKKSCDIIKSEINKIKY